jgi:hypothetical protein
MQSRRALDSKVSAARQPFSQAVALPVWLFSWIGLQA